MCTDVLGWFSKKYHPQDKRDLGAYIVHKIPLYRDLMLWLGVVDAGKTTAHKLLASGRSMYLIPGGVMEQMLTIEGKHRVYLNTRKGFVRLAVEFGTDLVPVYTFGETSLFSLSPFLLNFRLWIASKFQIAIPIFYSKRWGIPIPFLNYPVPLKVCVGPPIKVNQMSPSHPNFHEYVDEMHQQFKTALTELFEKHKVHCGYPDAILEFLPIIHSKTKND
uniref:diacylglycerol O-acyltransferase n=1 Tax=Arcella intermedia TaxID=1963864 RepID=A0A6B2LFU7_9EUKA